MLYTLTMVTGVLLLVIIQWDLLQKAKDRNKRLERIAYKKEPKLRIVK